MRSEVKPPSPQALAELGGRHWSTWSCGVSRFAWDYDTTEACFAVEGRVTVSTSEQTVTFGAGELGVFPAGPPCVRDVHEPVRRHDRFD